MPTYVVAFLSLGCAKNLVNTEQMMALAEKAGHTVVSRPEGADVAVLNTCGFIDSAKSEAIETVLELETLKQQGLLTKILVAGCLTQRYGEEILNELPEADGLIGCGSYGEVVSAIEQVMEGKTPRLFGDIDAPIQEEDRILSTPPWMAWIRIAEGCDNRCAYCVIPSIRGKYRSRTMEDVLAEAELLAGRGVKELIIIAQDITRYGADLYGKRSLAPLLSALCRIEGIHWIRLHYLYPDEIDEELINVVAKEKKIVHYIDIPIQHCNNKILKAMNRRGSKAELLALIHKLRERIPDLVLRTSIICGLPGEGEAEFEELCAFLRETEIERAGVFPFSPQEGTKAAALPGQADEETVGQRMELLAEIQSRNMDLFNASKLGTVMEVICEGFDSQKNQFWGRTYADSPDIDGRIYFSAPEQILAGSFVLVDITGSEDGDLVGRLSRKQE
ncbi:MAG: 30S ribosomal protein S12 methylthiotransferase RimO [Oscillospiraceae bacterium]|nr:30S ribosomal protein S12 methylthiotransferase RimO [Oscillospiraceae bacterium]